MSTITAISRGLTLAILLFSSITTATAADEAAAGPKSGKLLMFVGPYTGGKSHGIARFLVDLAGGKVEPLGETPALNPSFLAFDPQGKFLYAVSEVGDFAGKKSGAVLAFAIDRHSGELTPLNSQPSGGDGPCHLAVDPTGKNLLVANYGGGSVEVLPIAKDGRLEAPSDFVQHKGTGPDHSRQEGPHAHSIGTSPDGRFVLACDLGLDKVLVYRLDPAAGKLTPNDPPAGMTAPGAGPRHFTFSRDGRFVYVGDEMASTVTVFAYDADRGALKPLQAISTLPAGFKGETSVAEVEIDPAGRFLYCSNRGADSLAIFAVDKQTGMLTPAGHHSSGGKTPRHFTIDPSGEYLITANQDSHNVVVFRRDAATGQLKETGVEVNVDKPVCVLLIPQQ